MTSGVVLDASALLAMIREEPGGELVAGVVARARMSAVNFAEVVSYLTYAGVPPGQIEDMLTPLPVVVIDADVELAWMAGRLREATAQAGLSLGDRFCLALAMRDRLPAWTADRQWRTISNRIRRRGRRHPLAGIERGAHALTAFGHLQNLVSLGANRTPWSAPPAHPLALRKFRHARPSQHPRGLDRPRRFARHRRPRLHRRRLCRRARRQQPSPKFRRSTARSSPMSPTAARPTSTARSNRRARRSRAAPGATPTRSGRRRSFCASPSSSASMPRRSRCWRRSTSARSIGNSLTVDVPFCADCIQYYAEFADKLFDEIAPLGPQDLAMVRKEPLGVVGAIVPWNYPLIIAAWKLGPALVAGNSVDPEAGRAVAARLRSFSAALGKEAGLPDGVLNVVPGFGEKAGQAAGAASRCRHDRLHRFDRGRQADAGLRGPEQHEAGRARMRRQVAACGDAGRRPRRGR